MVILFSVHDISNGRRERLSGRAVVFLRRIRIFSWAQTTHLLVNAVDLYSQGAKNRHCKCALQRCLKTHTGVWVSYLPDRIVYLNFSVLVLDVHHPELAILEQLFRRTARLGLDQYPSKESPYKAQSYSAH